MAQRNALFHTRTGHVRLLLAAMIAFAFSACDRSPESPAPPESPPKPETQVRKLVSSGLKKALFSYSVRPNAPYQTEQPAAAKRPPVAAT